MNRLRRSLADIRTKAHELRDTFGDETRARALEWAAQEFESALAADDDQLLTLSQAAAYSGYSMDHLARLVRDGKIADARPVGSKGRLVLRKNDVPRKPSTRYIADTETHDLASRLFGGKEGR
jgi:hypothetical protein